MPGPYRKKKRVTGPSKNEEKVMRARNTENQKRLAANLGSRFPAVKRLKLDLAFLDARGNELDKRSFSLGPASATEFSQPCPGRCGRGSFDLGTKIAESVLAKLPLSEASIKCAETLYAGAAETCGVVVKYRLELEYTPAEAPPSVG